MHLITLDNRLGSNEQNFLEYMHNIYLSISKSNIHNK